MASLFAAAQDHRVTALDADGRRVGRDVRSRLVNEEHDSQRNATFGDLQSVRPHRRLDRLTDRIGQRRDLAQTLSDPVDTIGGQLQPIDLSLRQSVARRRLDISLIGLQDLVRTCAAAPQQTEPATGSSCRRSRPPSAPSRPRRGGPRRGSILQSSCCPAFLTGLNRRPALAVSRSRVLARCGLPPTDTVPMRSLRSASTKSERKGRSDVAEYRAIPYLKSMAVAGRGPPWPRTAATPAALQRRHAHAGCARPEAPATEPLRSSPECDPSACPGSREQ